jgi:hypothetical protein
VPARQRKARVWVEMHLTRSEIKELGDRAYADFWIGATVAC